MMTASLNVIKYLLFLFNVLFVITGIVLLAIGATIKAVYMGYHVFLDDRYFSAPNLLIAVGLIILLVSFLGCCGAVKENHCMIVSYIALLILIFILELSAGIAGYVCRDAAKDVLTQKLGESMLNYGKNDTVVTALWDLMQRTFECCGVNDPQDWITLAKMSQNTTVPQSCCGPASGFEPFTCSAESNPPRFKDGCTTKFGEFVRDKAVVIGGAGITIALIQLVGILMACRLASAMRRAVSELTPM
ncbi:CD63 antigen-like [Thrips palmi]|uniref:Tetraspanin n=1 Tax=Thrips palmi TaxID=161013 RepID=A0A6P9A559_THRPL|nr:CD63 antigen-like [Thrips palmi]